MLPKSYVVFKWVMYAVATLFLCALQSVVFSHISVFRLTPFLYPVLPALMAMFEGARPGSVFAFCLGLACDLLVPAPFRGFFVLIFPVAAVVSAWIAERLTSRGLLCGLIVSSVGLVLTDCFRLFVQILSGGQYLGLMARIALGEAILTLPAVLIALPMYRMIYRRCGAEY